MKYAVAPQTTLFVFTLSLLFSGPGGCRNQEQPPPPQASPPAESAAVKQESKIVVPPAVAGKWKAVRIAVVDKSNVTQKIYTIPIGGKLAIPSTSMTISVEAFLPAFIMEGGALTSSSNELTNPGAKVQIIDNRTVLFTGWLFAKFPSTHAFMHPRYGFTLIDAVPSGR